MKINLKMSKNLHVGKPIVVDAIIDFTKPRQVQWADVKLVVKRPCTKPFILSRREFLNNGFFERGSYHRAALLAANRFLVPSIHHNIKDFYVNASMNFIQDAPPHHPITIDQNFPLELHYNLKNIRLPDSRPVALGAGGMVIHLERDLFHPGEIVKGLLSCPGLGLITVQLKKSSTIRCQCPDYGANCAYVKKVPSIVLAEQKFKCKKAPVEFNLPIPADAEMSRSYCFSGTCGGKSNDSYGEEIKYFLKIQGKRAGIRYPPINVKTSLSIAPPIHTQEEEDAEDSEGPKFPEDYPRSFPSGAFEVSAPSWDDTTDQYRLNVTNRSNETYRGVSAQFWEEDQSRALKTYGFGTWNPGETKEIEFWKTGKSLVKFIVEDNDYRQFEISL
ncbi:MAG: hypothetical protein RBG13Loki_1145 [Promethearchaeota archaeon CR_4]|nr:MAG: hypothetical protein RBG13Loki_1145 [Candidatus Lokiarchaeota archaeon CR_4]